MGKSELQLKETQIKEKEKTKRKKLEDSIWRRKERIAYAIATVILFTVAGYVLVRGL